MSDAAMQPLQTQINNFVFLIFLNAYAKVYGKWLQCLQIGFYVRLNEI